MRVEFFHILDHSNAGDMASCPARYFEDWENAAIKHIRDWTPDTGRVSIFGGGGMLYHELHDILESAARFRTNKTTGPIILWGAGENMRDQCSLLRPAYLSEFDLVGLRDYPPIFNWVPCASCLGVNEFLKNMTPIFPIVVYEHYTDPLGLPYETMTNHSDQGSFEDRLTFLASGNVIITNTHHGAYWGTLVNRRVIIAESQPVSSRMYHFRFKPPMVKREEVRRKLHVAESFPDALAMCQSANRAFRLKVNELLSQ